MKGFQRLHGVMQNCVAEIRSRFRGLGLGIGLVAMALLGLVLVTPVQVFGDGSEYILTTQSILYDHDLRFDQQDVNRDAQLKPFGLATPDGLDLIKRGATQFFGKHSFYYSAAAAPFVWLFSYRGFYLLNALCFFAAFLLLVDYLAEYNGRFTAFLVALLGLAFSALLGYIQWIHAEIFYFFLLTASLYLLHKGRYWLAGVPLGLAIGALPVLAVVPAFYFLACLWRDKRLDPILKTGLVAVLFAAPQLAYNVLVLGTINPIAGQSAGLANIDLRSAIGSFIDPAYGLIWFYPLALFTLLNMRYSIRGISLLIGVVAFIVISNTTSNFFSHQVGLRYLVYAVPNLVFSLQRLSVRNLKVRLGLGVMVLVGTGLTTNLFGNSLNFNNQFLEAVPFTLVRDTDWYNYQPAVFSGMGKTLGSTSAMQVYSDGWTAGGATTRIMVVSKEPLRFATVLLGTWNHDTPQTVEVTTSVGVTKYRIEGRTQRGVLVWLTSQDVKWDQRTQRYYAYIGVHADGWVPNVATDGAFTGWHIAEPTRLLGVRLLAIAPNGRLDYVREGVGAPDTVGGVSATLMFRDGWTYGDFPSMLTLPSTSTAKLSLSVVTGVTGPTVRVMVSLPSGTREFALPANQQQTIDVPVTAKDIQNGIIPISITATGWRPADYPQFPGDDRSLGVRLTQITQGGRTLYQQK